MEKFTKAFLQARIDGGATHKDIAAITGLELRQVSAEDVNALEGFAL